MQLRKACSLRSMMQTRYFCNTCPQSKAPWGSECNPLEMEREEKKEKKRGTREATTRGDGLRKLLTLKTDEKIQPKENGMWRKSGFKAALCSLGKESRTFEKSKKEKTLIRL